MSTSPKTAAHEVTGTDLVPYKKVWSDNLPDSGMVRLANIIADTLPRNDVDVAVEIEGNGGMFRINVRKHSRTSDVEAHIYAHRNNNRRFGLFVPARGEAYPMPVVCGGTYSIVSAVWQLLHSQAEAEKGVYMHSTF